MTPQSLALEVSSLFSLPDLVMRALAVMDSPTGSAQQLVEVIELDAGLATTVLRLANSALYGHGQVQTLTHAVAMIGQNALRDLVVASIAVKTFKDIPVEFVDMDTYWDNSITCGVLARLIARRAKLPESEFLFIAGLLHGVGRLVFYATRPAQYREVLGLAQGGGVELTTAEQQVFGFNYADLGATLLEAWSLPKKLRIVVGHQLHPTQAPNFAVETSVIHLATQITQGLAPCLKTRQEPSAYTPDEIATATLQTLGISPAELDHIRLEALAASLEVIEIIHPGAATIF
jgi:HD-like signal output (HDOD) protein